MTRVPLTVVQFGSMGVIGDSVYRVHEPTTAMARLPGVAVYELDALSRQRDAAALAADVLVLTMTLDVEVVRLNHQRRLLGKPTICEVNDYLPDVQPWNPAHASQGWKKMTSLPGNDNMRFMDFRETPTGKRANRPVKPHFTRWGISTVSEGKRNSRQDPADLNRLF